MSSPVSAGDRTSTQRALPMGLGAVNVAGIATGILKVCSVVCRQTIEFDETSEIQRTHCVALTRRPHGVNEGFTTRWINALEIRAGLCAVVDSCY